MTGFQFLLALFGILVVFALLALWVRRMIGQITANWAPNTQFVNGTFSRFRTRLNGTYQERPILTYLGNEGGGEFGPTTFCYTLRMTVPPGFENWSMVCAVPRKGEPPEWTLKAKPGPADRLKAEGLLTAVEDAAKFWRLRYRAGSGRLELSIAGVGMYFCPDVVMFQRQLDLLSRLASITQAASVSSLHHAA